MGVSVLTGIVQSTKRHWAVAVTSARLYYNYLRLSPSYAAGCMFKQRRSCQKLNRHGKRILGCVEKYRDVHACSFDEWIKGPGRARVAAPSLMPEICNAETLTIGHQSDLFIRFPLGQNAMPQLELLAMISAMVPSASKELVATRLTPVMLKNLWRDVYLAYLIKNYPDTELWRLGAEAMLVDRFIGKVEPTGRRMNSSQEYERRLLSLTVIRHRGWAANVSEHAAIDEFPCKEAMPNGQQFLDFQATDLVPYLANHSSNEAMYAREQVIRCTGAMGRVSAEPSFRHQGLLF